MKSTALAAGSAAYAAAPDTLGATISDDKSVMLLAKYTYKQLKLYGGYEYIDLRQSEFADDVGLYRHCRNSGPALQYLADRFRQ